MKALSRIISVLVLTLAAGLTLQAQSVADMTLEENINGPAVPAKAQNALIRHIEKIGRTFAKHNLEVKYSRKGEVAKVILPASSLFDPNSRELKPESHRILNAFDAILKVPSLYKVLVVVYSDDTGSEAYTEELTEDRANAVDAYFASRRGADEALNVTPYGMGSDEPRASNASMAGRAANRRVEIYIVPERQLIDMARSGKL